MLGIVEGSRANCAAHLGRQPLLVGRVNQARGTLSMSRYCANMSRYCAKLNRAAERSYPRTRRATHAPTPVGPYLPPSRKAATNPAESAATSSTCAGRLTAGMAPDALQRL
jgi:hypothetical protein